MSVRYFCDDCKADIGDEPTERWSIMDFNNVEIIRVTILNQARDLCAPCALTRVTAAMSEDRPALMKL